MSVLDRFPRQREDVAARVIGGEAVVISPADSLVHELNTVATFVWERCDGRYSGWRIVDDVVDAFEASRETVAADVAELLRTLSDKGLTELLTTALEP